MILYPWVCKYFKFPIGHPTIHLQCDDIRAMLAKGLVRCTVLPPRDLYHPVLPYRCNGRLNRALALAPARPLHSLQPSTYTSRTFRFPLSFPPRLLLLLQTPPRFSRSTSGHGQGHGVKVTDQSRPIQLTHCVHAATDLCDSGLFFRVYPFGAP